MARKTVTEEDLGLELTEDELASTATPDDDAPVDTPDPSDDAPEADGGQPAKAEDADKSTPKADEEPRMVDVRALQEARNESRELKQQVSVLTRRWDEFLTAQQQPKEPEKPNSPDPKQNPFDALNYLYQKDQARDQETAEQTRQRAQAEQQQTEITRIYNEADAEFTEASAADPSVTDAWKALTGSYAREYQALGYAPQDIQQQLHDSIIQHAVYARQAGRPIADYIKSLATARGWQPQAAPSPEGPKPKTDIAAVASAQQRHQSLSDAPGGEGIAPLDAKALGRMSDKDFKSWLAKRGNEQKFEEIMGG